jgi:hypothetical protein
MDWKSRQYSVFGKRFEISWRKGTDEGDSGFSFALSIPSRAEADQANTDGEIKEYNLNLTPIFWGLLGAIVLWDVIDVVQAL